MIIIPDVHGRTFWKNAVNGRENEDIIFLGDYLDPYPAEQISPEDAITNFEEILQFKKEHLNNVTLLLGNHDFMTYLSTEMGNCRTDFLNAGKISSLFTSNLDLFKVADTRKINDRTYIFSHAPILKKWVEDNMIDGITKTAFFSETNDKTIEDIVYKLNWALSHKFEDLCFILKQVSWYRGGCFDFGSCVWADVREIKMKEPEFENCYEIFGHTQLLEHVITDYFADLDCRKAFELDNLGNLTVIQ